MHSYLSLPSTARYLEPSSRGFERPAYPNRTKFFQVKDVLLVLYPYGPAVVSILIRQLEYELWREGRRGKGEGRRANAPGPARMHVYEYTCTLWIQIPAVLSPIPGRYEYGVGRVGLVGTVSKCVSECMQVGASQFG